MRTLLPRTLIFLFLFILNGQSPVFAAKPILPVSKKTERLKQEDRPPKNKLAKWSLILTASGFLTAMIPYTGIVAPYLMAGGVVCGILALSQIKKTGEKGKGLAIASLILGGISFLIAIIAVAVLLSILN